MKKLLRTRKTRKTKKNSITFEMKKNKKNKRGFEHREFQFLCASMELLLKDCKNYI